MTSIRLRANFLPIRWVESDGQHARVAEGSSEWWRGSATRGSCTGDVAAARRRGAGCGGGAKLGLDRVKRVRNGGFGEARELQSGSGETGSVHPDRSTNQMQEMLH